MRSAAVIALSPSAVHDEHHVAAPARSIIYRPAQMLISADVVTRGVTPARHVAAVPLMSRPLVPLMP
jgi:hypothetical protein